MILALSTYYQERLKLHQATHTTMLSARTLESARTLNASPEARSLKKRLDEVKHEIKSLQSQVKAAKQKQRDIQKELPHRPADDEEEPQPKM